MCRSILCTTVTWTHRDYPGMSTLAPHKPCVWVSRVPQSPGISWDVHTCPPQTMCLSIPCTTVTWTHWDYPGMSICLSIPCTTVTWTHYGQSRDVQLAPSPSPHTQTMCLSIPCSTVTWTYQDYTGMSNLPPTNHVSEYPVYHSYLDTPGLSQDVHTCPPQTMCLSIPCTTVT